MTEQKHPAAGLALIPGPLQKILPLVDAHTMGESAIRGYARAVTDTERDAALDAIGEFARVLVWLVAPLAEKAHGAEAGSLCRLWAEQLKDFRRPWVRFHPADFPKEPDKHQQIIDRLESVEMKLTRRNKRQERRAAA